MTSTPPASRRISQDTLRKWEKSAREASVVCNQAAGFNRCLFKVQQEMQSQLKTIRGESKGKASKKISEASDELQFLMTFNSSITQAAAKAMEHLTDFVFITMGNATLVRRDSYLCHLKNGINSDTLAALRSAPLQIGTLFPDAVIKRWRKRSRITTIKTCLLLLMPGVKIAFIPMKEWTRNLKVGRRSDRIDQLGKT